MKQLIEDYKRRLATANEMINNLRFKDDANPDYIRLTTKRAEYRTIITELERELTDEEEKVSLDKKLIKNLIRANYKRSKKDDFSDEAGGTVKVFIVETEASVCKLWNSSDNSSFDFVSACSLIADKILDGDEVCEGTFSLGLKDIWFEIEEK